MADPTNTPVGTALAGTYYFFDRLIESEGRQYNGVRSGLKVTASSPASMVLQVEAGQFHRPITPGVFYNYPGGTVTLPTSDTNYLRVDTISIYWNGSAAVVVATPGVADNNSAPFPAYPFPIDDGVGYNIVLAIAVVYPGEILVGDDLIYDRRFFLAHDLSGPSIILATTDISVGGGSAVADKVAHWKSNGDLSSSDRDVNALGDVIGNAAPVILEQLVLYADTSGKVIGNSTSTGRPKLATGVLSVAPIDLASEVTGNLPKTRLNNGTAASAGTFWRGDEVWAAPPGGTGDVVGPAASIDNEVVLYSGTTGKLIKRATATGRPKLTAGVQSVAAIDLASEVTGDLPYAGLTPASAASRILLRGSAGGAGDWQEGTVGAGLSITGTVLAASGASGGAFASQSGLYNTDSTDRTLLSFTVPGGTWDANGGLLWFLTGYLLFNSGTPTWTLRFKYGATTFMGDVTSSTFSANVTRRALSIWGIFRNLGSTSAQFGTVEGYIGQITAGSVAGTMDIAVANTATFALITGHGSCAEDSTVDKTFSITSQFNVSNVAVECAWKGVAYLI